MPQEKFNLDWLKAASLDDDEYSGEGQAIDALHGIEEVDEYARPPSMEKMVKDAMQGAMDEIIDKMKQEGRIAEHAVQPVEEPKAFIDPEDDEDLSIHSDVMTKFWRIVIPGKRLIEIVTEEPSLEKLAMMGRNNAAGCWLAFTSKKIAQRMASTLTAKNITVDLHMCDSQGNKNVRNNSISPADHISPKKLIEDWRPWKQSGDTTETPYQASEFFYCLSVEGKTITVYFVPEIHWNQHRKIFDGELNIEHLVKSDLVKSKQYCYTTTHGELAVQSFLDRKGFRENLLFNAYINEVGL